MFRTFAFARSCTSAVSFARAAMVCVLVCTLPVAALAQNKRTIAIVNLSASPDAPAVATRARQLVTKTQGMRAISSGDLATALEGALPEGGPDAPAQARALAALTASEQAFGEFKSRLATSKLDEARRELFSIAPTEATTALLADVSFHMALIHLRAENMGLALSEFQLVHRLTPGRSVDPVRYPPSIVGAFEKARRKLPTKTSATLEVTATYNGDTIYLDGVAVGKAPLSIDVAPGAHIVAIAAPQYEATAQKVDIDTGDTLAIRLDLRPRSPVSRALDLRYKALAAGLGEESLRLAASRVSRLVGSDAVLVLRGQACNAALYIPSVNRLTFERPVDSNLDGMLALATPVARPTILDAVGKPSERSPWLGIAAVAGALALGIVGGFATVGADDSEQRRQGVFGWGF